MSNVGFDEAIPRRRVTAKHFQRVQARRPILASPGLRKRAVRAEATAVISTSSIITRNGEPLARFAAQMATYSNTPVRRTTPTMIIMPSRRKITSQSTPLSWE
jgi:hypothetical protein